MKTAEDNVKKKNVEFNLEEEVDVLKGNPERYAGVYRELADILGDAAVKKIWKRFSGVNVTFPQRLFSKEYTKEFIKQHWKDMSASEIARTVGLSERRVRQIASDIQKEDEEV
ncbi:MAG: hypothetical protein K6F30_09905 [Lachnospiraceae bacterium]|nr:hypothetical protein [Lachnospiraceae bacterium]